MEKSDEPRPLSTSLESEKKKKRRGGRRSILSRTTTMSDPLPPAPPSAAAAAALSRRSEPRQLKELRNLAPWRWDKLCDKHPPGKKTGREEERERSEREARETNRFRFFFFLQRAVSDLLAPVSSQLEHL